MINWGGLKFHWYGLILGVAMVTAWEISAQVAKTKKIKRDVIDKLFVWTVIGGMIGARLYHVVDLWNGYYLFDPVRIFYVWEGGLGIWGAIAGGVIGLWIAGKYSHKELKTLNLLDIGVSGLPLAQAIGRLGNWANGELYGKLGEPLFAYEAGLNLFLFGLMWKWRKQAKPGRLTGIYLVGYGIIRMALENLREEAIIWRINGIPMAIVFSTIAILIGSGLILRKQS